MKQSLTFLLLLLVSLSSYAADFSCEGIYATKEIAHDAAERFHSREKLNLLNDFINSQLDDEHLIQRTEELALKLYSGAEYVHINSRLRKESIDQEFESFILVLCSALNKRDSYQGTVYRVAKLTPDIQAQYIEGELITEKAFTSSSQTKSGIKKFMGVQKMNTFFTIESLNGKDISTSSGRPEEKEILFPAGSQFQVTKVKESFFGDTLNIWLKQVK